MALVRGPGLEEAALREALTGLVRRHPLLRARIAGTGRVAGAPAAGVRMGATEVDPLRWAPCALAEAEVVGRALTVEAAAGGDGGVDGSSWYAGPFEAALDATDFDQVEGPLWRLRVLNRRRQGGQGGAGEAETALLFAFNHAISDQASANTIVHELLSALASSASAPSAAASPPPPPPVVPPAVPQPFPPSIEEAVLAGRGLGLNTLRYAVREGVLGALPCTILPHPSRRPPSMPGASSSWGLPAATRTTLCELRRLEPPVLSALAAACRRRGLTVTAALSAAMLHVTSDFAHAPPEAAAAASGGGMQLYRLLLSLNMRAFSARKRRGQQQQQQQQGGGGGPATDAVDWADGAVASAAGAMDYLARLPAGSGARLLLGSPSSSSSSPDAHEGFWAVAGQCRRSYEAFVAAGFVPESVALFDWGVRAIELNEVVEKEAENAKTLGRAYTCGVSNMGVFPGPRDGAYGPHRLAGLHYATSSSLTGTLYQLSCGTAGGALCLTLHFASPLVDRATAGAFADALVRVLARVVEAEAEGEVV